MSSLSMATAVCARNGAADRNEAMPIAATVTYRLALSVMGALLVRIFAFARAALRTRRRGLCTQSMPPRNKPHRRSHIQPVPACVKGTRSRAFALAAGEARALRPRSAVEREPKEPAFMMSKAFSIAAAAGLLIATTALGHAESATQRYAPGQRMQEHGSVPGQPGASGYSPGHQCSARAAKPASPAPPATRPAISRPAPPVAALRGSVDALAVAPKER